MSEGPEGRPGSEEAYFNISTTMFVFKSSDRIFGASNLQFLFNVCVIFDKTIKNTLFFPQSEVAFPPRILSSYFLAVWFSSPSQHTQTHSKGFILPHGSIAYEADYTQ